eukprot:6176455-Pleurochrysis_carterae.AAC.1
MLWDPKTGLNAVANAHAAGSPDRSSELLRNTFLPTRGRFASRAARAGDFRDARRRGATQTAEHQRPLLLRQGARPSRHQKMRIERLPKPRQSWRVGPRCFRRTTHARRGLLHASVSLRVLCLSAAAPVASVFQDCFNKYDLDRTGTIDGDELSLLLRDLKPDFDVSEQAAHRVALKINEAHGKASEEHRGFRHDKGREPQAPPGLQTWKVVLLP